MTTTEDVEGSGGTSRRRFLRLGGASAAAIAAAVGVPDLVEAAERGGGREGGGGGGGAGTEAGPGRFDRMFDDLDPFAAATDEVTEALIELSRPEGLLDANDDVDAGPLELLVNPDLSANNPDNPEITAGMTFLGQFIDHDITRDAGSTLGRPTSLRRSTNLRTARLDLDTVYGGGPQDSPELYDVELRLRVESGGRFEDLPRSAEGDAIIGDPRNGENLMISGLHVAMLLFHNAVMDRVEATGLSGSAAFEEARRLVRWHYQWIVLHEFLPVTTGPISASVLADGRRFFTPNRARIPVEFQTAAFRFGHSQVRPSYRANLTGDDGEAFVAMVFDVDQIGSDDPDDLSGGHRAPRRFIDWQTFFDFDDDEVRPNKMIDSKISSPLFRLPAMTIDRGRGEPPGPTSLATRNLLRHLTWELPSGQAVADSMGVERLGTADLGDVAAFGADLGTSTPLWLYILEEAEIIEGGVHLGPVGGGIVAEVLIGLLELDPTSFLGADPTWRPTLPSVSGRGEFTVRDLLTVAGVDPQSRAEGRTPPPNAAPLSTSTPLPSSATVQTGVAERRTRGDRAGTGRGSSGGRRRG